MQWGDSDSRASTLPESPVQPRVYRQPPAKVVFHVALTCRSVCSPSHCPFRDGDDYDWKQVNNCYALPTAHIAVKIGRAAIASVVNAYCVPA